MFIAALFTTMKMPKQPKYPSINEWIEHLWNIYTMEYYLDIKKEEYFTLCNGMDGAGEYYAQWNKSVKERQLPYDFTNMWNVMNKLN